MPLLAVFALLNSGSARAETISIVLATNAAPRVEFGAEKIAEALKAVKLDAAIGQSVNVMGQKILVNRWPNNQLPKEGFSFGLGDNNDISISSSDDSGALYGCLELAKRIHAEGKLPTTSLVNFQGAPVMKLRGDVHRFAEDLHFAGPSCL